MQYLLSKCITDGWKREMYIYECEIPTKASHWKEILKFFFFFEQLFIFNALTYKSELILNPWLLLSSKPNYLGAVIEAKVIRTRIYRN